MIIKKILLSIMLCLIALPAYTQTIYGEVKKVEEVRQEVFLKPIWVIDPHPYKAYAEKAPEGYRVDYSDGRYSVATGTKMFGYQDNKLVVISIYNKSIFEYPRTGYQYSYPDGKLIAVSSIQSKGNSYEFNPDGSLIGIWENGIFYKGDKILLTTKVSSF